MHPAITILCVRQSPSPLFLMMCGYFRKDMLFVGNPAWVTLSGVSVLIYHGRSIDDLVLRLPGISYAAPEKAMIEMLRRRHLAPIYGSRVSIAPEHETIMLSPGHRPYCIADTFTRWGLPGTREWL